MNRHEKPKVKKLRFNDWILFLNYNVIEFHNCVTVAEISTNQDKFKYSSQSEGNIAVK